MSRQLWVRLENDEEGGEIPVDVPTTGVVHDLLAAALTALDFGPHAPRTNQLRAVGPDGDLLPNRAPVAGLPADGVIVVKVKEARRAAADPDAAATAAAGDPVPSIPLRIEAPPHAPAPGDAEAVPLEADPPLPQVAAAGAAPAAAAALPTYYVVPTVRSTGGT
eukprot:gene28510-36670_t